MSADGTVLLAENERMLRKVMNEFDWVCNRRKLKVNIDKNKVMEKENAEGEIISFARQYLVRTYCMKECEICLGRRG